MCFGVSNVGGVDNDGVGKWEARIGFEIAPLLEREIKHVQVHCSENYNVEPGDCQGHFGCCRMTATRQSMLSFLGPSFEGLSREPCVLGRGRSTDPTIESHSRCLNGRTTRAVLSSDGKKRVFSNTVHGSAQEPRDHPSCRHVAEGMIQHEMPW